MGVLSKQDIPRPARPKETVTVKELGGDVVLQGLFLRHRLALASPEKEPFERICRVLAGTVLDAEGHPIFDVDEWETWGAQNYEAFFRLLEIVYRLSGYGDAAKNPKAQS